MGSISLELESSTSKPLSLRLQAKSICGSQISLHCVVSGKLLKTVAALTAFWVNVVAAYGKVRHQYFLKAPPVDSNVQPGSRTTV